MKTAKLFYKDPYMREFDALATACELDKKGGFLVELKESAFYPEGGGQPADTGVLVTPDGRAVKVSDVQEQPDGRILHICSGPVEPGSVVHGTIDWERRFDHMQQHSGEHIVSGMICKAFGCDNVGFHLGAETVTIDFNAEIRPEELETIEARANAYIWEDHELEELWPSPEELVNIDYRSKKELTGEVRITRFPGADCCACCGTHLKRSSEVGLCKVISCNKFTKGTRIELLCGKRAFDFLKVSFEQNQIIARGMAASLDKTAAVYQKQKEELIGEKLKYGALEQRYFELIAKSYEDAGNVFILEDGLSPDSLRKLCVLVGNVCSGRCICLSGEQPEGAGERHGTGHTGNRAGKHAAAGTEAIQGRGDKAAGDGVHGHAAAASARSGYKYACIYKDHDISGFIKEMNRALNGRGGGRNGFAQGSLNASEEDIRKFLESAG